MRLRKLTSTLVIAAFSLAVLALTGCEDSSAVSELGTTPASGSAGPAAPETPRPTAAPQPTSTATAEPTATPPPTAPQPTATAAPTATPVPSPTATAARATDRNAGADRHRCVASDVRPAADRSAAYGRRRGAANRNSGPANRNSGAAYRHGSSANGHGGPTQRHYRAADCRPSAGAGQRGRAASALLYAAEIRRRDFLDRGASGAGQPGDRLLPRILVNVLPRSTR